MEYLEQEGQTVRSTVEHFPGITRETVVGIYRNSSELVDAICNIAKTKTVHDNPNDKSMGFLGTIQYHLIQSGCAYPDDAVKAVIRKLYY